MQQQSEHHSSRDHSTEPDKDNRASQPPRKHRTLWLILVISVLTLLASAFYGVYCGKISYRGRRGRSGRFSLPDLSFFKHPLSELKNRRSRKFAVGIGETERRLLSFYPQLQELGQNHPDDVEIQLGLALLHRTGKNLARGYSFAQNSGRRAPKEPPKLFSDDRFFELPKKFGKNRAAWALVANSFQKHYAPTLAKLIECRHELKSLSIVAERQRADHAKPHERSVFYRHFSKGGEGVEVEKDDQGKLIVTVTDFDLADKQLTEWIRERTGAEVAAVAAMLDKGHAIDPDNALYDYLKANLYLDVGENEKAFRQIKEALTKKYWSNYPDELGKARQRVLREVEFPSSKMRFLDRYPDNSYNLARSFIRKSAPLAVDHKNQGNPAKAKRIFELMLRMGKQVKESPMPFMVGPDQIRDIQDWAKHSIDKLEKEMPTQTPDSRSPNE